MLMKKKKKATKPASEAQKLARERNWNKGQVLCIKSIAHRIYKSKTTSKKEKSYLALMERDLDTILTDWNKPAED